MVVPGRTKAEIVRNFPTSCISCKFRTFIKDYSSATLSRCTYFNETVEHFNSGCDFHERTKKLPQFNALHIEYLINSPLFN